MQWADHWVDQLAELGLGEIDHSLDTAAALGDATTPPHGEIGHDNGHITAVRVRSLSPDCLDEVGRSSRNLHSRSRIPSSRSSLETTKWTVTKQGQEEM